ncbi:MAG: diaminopimelate epimerase [Syntrophothermus sp.]
MHFVKMHGIGNDYVYIDGFREKVDQPEELARKVSDRHFGIGSDGLILILPSETADLRMRMFNADGSESEMCGNGIRCVAKYGYDHGLARKEQIAVETLAGIKTLDLVEIKDGKAEKIRVDMGRPRLSRAEIPMVVGSEEDPAGKVINQPLVVDGQTLKITGVSMGNPHCVLFVDDTETAPVHELGPRIERHPAFPARTNVEFCQVIDEEHLKMRVWERGSGETLACGTGACATAVAGVLNGHARRRVTIQLLGGTLEIYWNPEDDHVYMTGPAVEVFAGEFDPRNL